MGVKNAFCIWFSFWYVFNAYNRFNNLCKQIWKIICTYIISILQISSIDFIKIDSTVDLKQEKIATKQYANLYEALIGAVYLDGGIFPAKQLILNTVWKQRSEAWKSVNHKGQLIEFCHIRQLTNPKFLVSDVSGPDHQKLFEVHVKIGEKIYPSGIGSSKKSAEQYAAQYAMEALET